MTPRVEEPFGDLDGDVQQAAGVPPEVEHQRPHPLPAERRDRLVEFLGGGLLEPGELDVADAAGGVDDLGLRDALDLDVAADQPVALSILPSGWSTVISTGVPSFPWSRLAASSRLSPRTGLAADVRDQVAHLEPGLPGRAAADHADEPEPLGVELQLDAQPDEVAVDHGIEVVELVGGEVARVIVEGVAGAVGELEDDGGGADAEGLSRQIAGGEHLRLRRGAVGDGEAGTLAAGGPRGARRPAPGRGSLGVGAEELGVAEGDLQVVEPPADERFERRRGRRNASRSARAARRRAPGARSRGSRSRTLRKLWSW